MPIQEKRLRGTPKNNDQKQWFSNAHRIGLKKPRNFDSCSVTRLRIFSIFRQLKWKTKWREYQDLKPFVITLLSSRWFRTPHISWTRPFSFLSISWSFWRSRSTSVSRTSRSRPRFVSIWSKNIYNVCVNTHEVK